VTLLFGIGGMYDVCPTYMKPVTYLCTESL